MEKRPKAPRPFSRKGSKKESKEKPGKKKSKFLVSEDDNLDMSDLDRSAGGSSVTTGIVENFVASSLSS